MLYCRFDFSLSSDYNAIKGKKEKIMPAIRNSLLSAAGSAVLAFGMYQIHSQGAVTEGGILGLTLLCYHWFSVSPAVSALVLNAICYAAGWKVLGKQFLLYSALSGGLYSLFYGLFEQMPLLCPELGSHPLLSAAGGAVFVGVGVGLCVRAGGAPSGDDALAMTLCKLTAWPIERFYLISDLIVLLASMSYIPIEKIFYSLITVVLSGKIIGLIQRQG